MNGNEDGTANSKKKQEKYIKYEEVKHDNNKSASQTIQNVGRHLKLHTHSIDGLKISV